MDVLPSSPRSESTAAVVGVPATTPAVVGAPATTPGRPGTTPGGPATTPAVVGAPATTPGEPRPPCPPSRSLSSSAAAAADCGPGGGSLPRLVAARRAVETQHQPAESQSAGSSLVVNGDCSAPGCSGTSSPTSTAVPPTYGVDSDDVDALRHVRTHLITHREHYYAHTMRSCPGAVLGQNIWELAPPIPSLTLLSPSSFLCPFAPPLPPLRTRPLKYSYSVWGSAISFPSGVWAEPSGN